MALNILEDPVRDKEAPRRRMSYNCNNEGASRKRHESIRPAIELAAKWAIFYAGFQNMLSVTMNKRKESKRHVYRL